VHSQLGPHWSSGAVPAEQVAVQGLLPHSMTAPMQVASPHSIVQLPAPQWRATSPQASTPAMHSTVQVSSAGHMMSVVSHASVPSHWMRQA
jgi:hypothetical protein